MKGIIGVLEGDYIGPEITGEAVKVLKTIAQKYDHSFELMRLYASGEAYDKFGQSLPEITLKKAQKCDALLKGPFGGPPEEINHPKWSNIEGETILPLRKKFALFTNLREIKVYNSLLDISPLRAEIIRDTNILIVRELISGIYFGEKKLERKNNEKIGSDLLIYRESEIKRIAKKAFTLAQKRKKRVTLVAKANILKSSQLWKEVVNDIAQEFPDIDYNYLHVDNASMQLIKNPGQFDVILTGNMFGDILSDEASVLSGSIGLQPSASLGSSSFGMYEPIHGSAPSIAGKDIANPISSILSGALMLRYTFELDQEAADIEEGVNKVLDKGYRTKDLVSQAKNNNKTSKIVGTKEMGDLICNEI
ncbi:MAG: 3-isopropylmalate dehydrogenase [bacterium]